MQTPLLPSILLPGPERAGKAVEDIVFPAGRGFLDGDTATGGQESEDLCGFHFSDTNNQLSDASWVFKNPIQFRCQVPGVNADPTGQGPVP